MEKCEIGAAAWGFRELDLEEQLKLCQRLGFSSLELGIANAPKDVPLDATDEEIQKIKDFSNPARTCSAETRGRRARLRLTAKKSGPGPNGWRITASGSATG